MLADGIRSRAGALVRRKLVVVSAAGAFVLCAGAGVVALGASGGEEPRGGAGKRSAKTPERREPVLPALRPRPKVVDPVAGESSESVPPEELPAGSAPPSRSAGEAAEEQRDVERELTLLSKLSRAGGGAARVTRGGTAVPPSNAPATVQQVIAGANLIARTPYRYGGGHNGKFEDSAYDCSGSVSFALASAGLLAEPLASGGFMKWGAPGKGKWITIYANPGHMFMVVAGLRYDTSGRANGGTRWQATGRSTGGYEVRHPPGL